MPAVERRPVAYVQDIPIVVFVLNHGKGIFASDRV